MITGFLVFLAAAVLSLLLTWPLFWLLRVFKVGQPVRPEGPITHQAKAGTPTMGGIGLVLAGLILALILIDFDLHPQYLLLAILILFYALIGLTDDLLKIWRHQNQGLTFWQKIILQVAVAAVFAMVLTAWGENLKVAGFLGWLGFTNPYLYQLLIIIMVVGFGNATNLTDGLNGLLAGTGTIALVALAVMANRLGMFDAATFALALAGALFAFLYFNFPKAKLFMGDVGSLAVGAALAGLAIILHKEFKLLLVGGLFVAEALSVIIQVGSYKLFKKRVFKMTPLHHHFELLGYSEKMIVIAFWTITLILGLAAIWI